MEMKMTTKPPTKQTRPGRDCLGRNLAIAEIRTVLITLLASCVVERGWKDGDEDEDDPGHSSATMRPRYGPRVKIVKRSL